MVHMKEPVDLDGMLRIETRVAVGLDDVMETQTNVHCNY
jgi:hypothetical protein